MPNGYWEPTWEPEWVRRWNRERSANTRAGLSYWDRLMIGLRKIPGMLEPFTQNLGGNNYMYSGMRDLQQKYAAPPSSYGQVPSNVGAGVYTGGTGGGGGGGGGGSNWNPSSYYGMPTGTEYNPQQGWVYDPTVGRLVPGGTGWTPYTDPYMAAQLQGGVNQLWRQNIKNLLAGRNPELYPKTQGSPYVTGNPYYNEFGNSGLYGTAQSKNVYNERGKKVGHLGAAGSGTIYYNPTRQGGRNYQRNLTDEEVWRINREQGKLGPTIKDVQRKQREQAQTGPYARPTQPETVETQPRNQWYNSLINWRY